MVVVSALECLNRQLGNLSLENNTKTKMFWNDVASAFYCKHSHTSSSIPPSYCTLSTLEKENATFCMKALRQSLQTCKFLQCLDQK